MTFHHVDDVFSLILLTLLLLLKMMLLMVVLLSSLYLSFGDFESIQLREDVMKYLVSNSFDVLYNQS
jgi:hypothetical protein